MRVETLQTLQLPENKTFIDEFTLSYGESGLVVYCRSKVIATWVKSYTVGKPAQAIDPTNCAFDVADKKFYFIQGASNLDPHQRVLINRDPNDGAILVNACFLAMEGLEDGVELSVRLPVSQVDASDYYHACLQFFQQLYADYIRPFSISAIMKEVDDASA